MEVVAKRRGDALILEGRIGFGMGRDKGGGKGGRLLLDEGEDDERVRGVKEVEEGKNGIFLRWVRFGLGVEGELGWDFNRRG